MARARPPRETHDRAAPALALADAAPAAALLALAGFAAFALQLQYAWPFTADDAFITFRYAENWASGAGPNFNTDGSRSEGVTSFGFLALSALFAALGADLVVCAKFIGVASALATAGLLARFTSDLDEIASEATPEPVAWSGSLAGRALLAAAFAFFAWLAFFGTAVHAASGMETLLAAALLTALARSVVLATLRGEQPKPSTGWLALLLGLLRPELNAAALVAFGCGVLRSAPAMRPAWWRAIGLAYLLPGSLYFAARATYYGQLFPIPFYAKVRGGELFPNAANAEGLGLFLLACVGLPVAISLIASARTASAIAAIALAAALVAALPDPVMDFDYRYATPALPLVLALAGSGFARLAELVLRSTHSARKGSMRWQALALSAVAAGALAAQSWDPARNSLRERRAYGLALEGTNARLGRLLADFRERSGRTPLMALGDVGAIPYYSRWRALDTFSLNDPAIAIGGRDDPAYVLDQNPDLVIAVSTSAQEFRPHWANRHDGPLFEAARARGMRPAVILTFSAASFLFVLSEPGSEIETYLREIYLERASSPH
jgi:hypothetical protein